MAKDVETKSENDRSYLEGVALGPFTTASAMSWSSEFPRLYRVRQQFVTNSIVDLQEAVYKELTSVPSRLEPGMRVAITAGSREIANIVDILKFTGQFLKESKAVPFIVPAMGSHGGGSFEGQRGVLEHLGVTEESVDMEIKGSDEVVEIGTMADGLPVVIERTAFEADAILVVNRVKPHTDFHGDIESGLAKILAIGLGKQKGASGLHGMGPDGLSRLMPLAAREIVRTQNVLGGLAILENSEHRVERLAFVEPEGIGEQQEAALLAEADQLLARLPFDDLDVLVISELGKDKSGTGIDPNVIGRMRIEGVIEPERPRIAVIVALGLSPGSGGNATGIGLADITTQQAVSELDLYATYLNTLTAGLGGIRRAAIPIAMPTQMDAIAAGLSACGKLDPKQRRVVCIRDTLSLSQLLVSESLLDEVRENPKLELDEELGAMTFLDNGDLVAWAD